MAKPIWRKVLGSTEHLNPGAHKSRYTGGRTHLTLEGCGHELYRKISQGVPAKARCSECERLSTSTGTSTLYHGDGTKTVTTWNAELGLPHRETMPGTFEGDRT